MAEVEKIAEGGVGLELCADLFGAEPVGCNIVATSLIAGQATELWRASEGRQTLGAGVAWENGWTLSALRSGAADLLAGALPIDKDMRLMGSAGDVTTTAGHCSELAGGGIELDELFRIYRLVDLQIPAVPGRLVPPGSEKVDLAAQWIVEFGVDIGHERDLSGALIQMARAIDQGRFFAWETKGVVVSQLLVSVERFGVVRIGGVYTPPVERGHGYASALTAAVSKQLLTRSEVGEVILNTQASNSMSNRLYRRLGFESAAEILSVWLRV